MDLITCNDLTLGYDGGAVVSGLSFTVAQGDYLCIVGENGSGKSTLMKAILGLNEPISGDITFGGGLERREIGYLPQQTRVQRDFPASVWEIVLSGTLGSLKRRPFYGRRERELALENLERLGIADLKKRCYRELSGGQQQRVLLARALCASKKLLLLDEPAAGLDPSVINEMYGVISELNRQGITVIMISHDVNAVKYASAVLNIGDRFFFGTPEEFMSRENIFTKGGAEQ